MFSGEDTAQVSTRLGEPSLLQIGSQLHFIFMSD
jgi:hypothetical protein